MKVAFLSESPADEAAIGVFVQRVPGTEVEPVVPALRARGWPDVLRLLPAVVRHP